MTESNAAKQAQEAAEFRKSTIDTAIDAYLSGVSDFLAQVNKMATGLAEDLEGYVNGDGNIVIENVYEDLVTNVPDIVKIFPNAATLSIYFRNTAFGLGLLSAATKIATSQNPVNEILKQGIIFDASFAADAAVTVGLGALLVGAGVAAAPAAAIAAVLGAVANGLTGVGLNLVWDDLDNSVQRGFANGLTPNNAAAQAAINLASTTPSWLTQNGGVVNAVQSALQNPQFIDGNIIWPNPATVIPQLESQLLPYGYYIPQSSDTANSIATQVQANNGISISGTELQRINALLPNSNLSAGGLVYTPIVATAGSVTAPVADAGQVVVFDAPQNTSLSPVIYTVGASYNDNNDGSFLNDGTLVVLTADGNSIQFAANTWLNVETGIASNGDATANITLIAPEQALGVLGDPNVLPAFSVQLGTLTIDTITDAASFTYMGDGQIMAPALPLNPISGHLSVSDPTETPLEVLEGYIADLGIPSGASLDSVNYAMLNPSGTPYTVTGTDGMGGPDDNQPYEYFLVNGTPGAAVTGMGGRTNDLEAEGDLSQDTITGIQVLNAGYVSLTADQLDSFSSIEGGGSLTLTTAGTIDLTSPVFAGSSFGALTAQDWGGTTLIGDDTDDQSLTASLFGNDTLTAGNGIGDTLTAGEGVDTITGGTGGDTFVARSGLADGSSITGNGDGNLLDAAGDISGASISGIQTLYIDNQNGNIENSITLTAEQLGGFTTVEDGGTIYASGGGTYSVAADSGGYIMYADPTGNTTLISNDSGTFLYADDSSGNNTLSAGSGQDSLSADGSSGNNSLTAGGGSFDYLHANDSTGANMLTAGDGLEDILMAEDSDGDNTLIAGGGASDYLSVNGSSGNNTVTSGNGDADKLYAQNSSGNNVLTAGSGAGDVQDASGSIGNNTLNAGSGGDTLYAGDGTDTLNGGTGDDTYYLGDIDAPTTIINGGGGSDTLMASGDISAMTINGVSTLDMYLGDTVTLTASELSGFTTIEGIIEVVIYAAGAGSYSVADQAGLFTMYADLTANTTLTGNDADSEELSAAGTSGSNTLNAGNGNYDLLYADHSTGNNTLNATGTGTGDALSAANSQGNNHLNLGNAADGIEEISGSSGNNVLIAGNGDSDVLDAESTSGNNTLTASNGIGDVLNATASTGNNTLTGGSGGDTFYAGNGVTNMYGGSGDDTYELQGSGTVQDGGGSNSCDVPEIASGQLLQFTIDGYHTDSDSSALQYASGIAPSNVVLTEDGENLVATVVGQESQVTIDDYFASSDYQMAIDFSNGTSWDAATVASMVSTPVTLAANVTETFMSSGNVVNASNTDTVALNGSSGDFVTLSGSGNTVSDSASSTENAISDAASSSDNTYPLAGGGDSVSISGSNSNAILSGSYASADLTGVSDGATLDGDNETATVPADSDLAYLNGSGDTAYIYASNNTVNVSGNSDTVSDTGGDDTIALGGTSDTANIRDSGDAVTITGTTDTVNVTRNGNIITDESTGGNTIYITGSSNTATITGSGDTATIYGSSDTVNDTGIGGDTVSMNGTGDGSTIAGSGDTVNLTGGGDTVTDSSTGSNTLSLTGSGDIATINNTVADSLTVGGASNTIDMTNNVTGSATATINGTNALLQFGGATTDEILFGRGATGMLLLNSASSFAGTVAGLASSDSIDLGNFLFSGAPTISSVTGTGAINTDTDVTVTDGSHSATLALLNQYTNQFGVSSSAYTLSADKTGSSAGTLFQLAAAH
jgi:RTX calcium-binding nonapeptide repeat (4 copies)/Haemolysin-type calcium binding protein related domain